MRSSSRRRQLGALAAALLATWLLTACFIAPPDLPEPSTRPPALTPTLSPPAPAAEPAPSPTATPPAASSPATPQPATPAALPTSQPAARPIRAAFFYPWFPQAWTQRGISPYTNYTPSLGYYASTDDATIDRQLQLAADAHLDAFISSWWGPGHHTDAALQRILTRSARADSPNPSLRWAVYYEGESQGDPSVARIVADVKYLARTFFGSPAYLRVGGRPVLFVYADAADGADMARRWAQAKAELGGDLYLVLKVYPGYRADPNQPDSWHQYAPAQPYDGQLPYSATVSPGFWKAGEAPRLPRHLGRFAADVQRLAASSAFWQLITSWNEWGEGTSVEPAQEYSTAYLEVLCAFLGGADCATTPAGAAPPLAAGTPGPATRATPARPAPSPTPAARLTPTPAPASPTPVSRTVIVAAAGDIACGSASGGAACRQADVAAVLEQIDPEAVLALGDVQYERGEYEDFLRSFDLSWGRLRARIRPAVGNHEYLTRGAAGYFDYFNGVGQRTGPAGDREKGYYSFDLGEWRLFAINSNCRQAGGCQAGSPQEQWLRAELAARPTRCSLMYMHHPLWSSDRREFETTELKPLFQAFAEAGGELVLAGHSHFYERFAPQTPEGVADPERGIRQIIVGTGGRNVYGFGPIRPNSEVRDGQSFGALRLALHPTSYEWRFVPIAGQTFSDEGRQSCR